MLLSPKKIVIYTVSLFNSVHAKWHQNEKLKNEDQDYYQYFKMFLIVDAFKIIPNNISTALGLRIFKKKYLLH